MEFLRLVNVQGHCLPDNHKNVGLDHIKIVLQCENEEPL